jgi:hypothetical protein
MTTLVAGWFSFEGMGASAGDIQARDVVCSWLQRAGRDYDLALAPPFVGGVYWSDVDPDRYAEVVFVCGPVGNGEPLAAFIERFRGRRLIGVNVTMLESLDEWNPFDLLYERDSSAETRPDVVFAATPEHVPVIGLVLIDSQPEYGDRDLHPEVDYLVGQLLSRVEAAVVRIDTRLDANSSSLRTAAEIESIIARMDAVVTTRLHGLVLAIKNGVPALAIDTVSGGAKVRRQAESIGWPLVLAGESLELEELERALLQCLSDEARALAGECATWARAAVEKMGEAFVRDLRRL